MHSDALDGEQPTQLASLTMPATVAECHAVIQALALEVAQLREQMGWLQERLKVDSRNSSKPPSSDCRRLHHRRSATHLRCLSRRDPRQRRQLAAEGSA
jgi:hypothetical protein